MEVDGNRWSVYGYPRNPPVGQVVSREQGWANAAEYVNGNTKLTLSGDNVRKRMTRYKQLYYKTAAASKKTGAGVSEGGGAECYDEELAAKCPFFDQMDKMFCRSPYKEPHGEMSTATGGVITFPSRKRTYVMRSSSVGCGEGGAAATVILDNNEHEEAVGVQRVQKNGVNQQYGEGQEYEDYDEDQELEEGRELESGEEAEYNVAREEPVQESQQTMAFQGDAFTEFRSSWSLRSERDLTTKFNSPSKRQHSTVRSTVPKGSSRRVTGNSRQQSVGNLHSHRPLGKTDGLISSEILMNAKAEANFDLQEAKLKHEKEMEEFRLQAEQEIEQERLRYQQEFEQERLKLEQERLKLEHEQRKLLQDQEKLRTDHIRFLMKEKRLFLENIIAGGRVPADSLRTVLNLYERGISSAGSHV